MFNEIHQSKGLSLVFVKSSNIQAFPCGRRRSQEVNAGGDKYYIPFDPEARLNTEYNNLRHSSLNGFTQSYINKLEQNTLSLVINNYLFNISLDANLVGTGETTTEENFGSAIATAVGEASTADKIYANIRIAQVPLYSGFTTYNTTILRDQTTSITPSTVLDLVNQEANSKPELLKTAPENYFYFAGLSFSTEALADIEADSTVFSLQILEKDGTWKLYQPSLLPKIEHGVTSDSIKVGTVYADNVLMQISADGGDTRNVTIPSIELVKQGTSDIFKLTISSVTTTP